MLRALTFSISVTILNVPAWANDSAQCVADLSSETYEAFSKVTEQALEELGVESITEFVQSPHAADEEGVLSTKEWMVESLCPFRRDTLTQDPLRIIAAKTELREWLSIANALFHVELERARPDVWSEMRASLQAFRTSLMARFGSDEIGTTDEAEVLLEQIANSAASNSRALAGVRPAEWLADVGGEDGN